MRGLGLGRGGGAAASSSGAGAILVSVGTVAAAGGTRRAVSIGPTGLSSAAKWRGASAMGSMATGMAGAAVMMDINQIELLRGPQGTRYGTNALAGMVNIRSNDPTEELSGSIEGGVADYQTWNLGAAVGGPLAERLLGRFAIRRYKSDGYLQNDFLGRDDTNSRDEFSVRGKLRWLGTGIRMIGDLLVEVYDIIIFAPLWIETQVKGHMNSPRKPAVRGQS